MKYNPNIHHRGSIRLKGYDYSQAGLYFITICTQERLCLFGKIENEEMILHDAGVMIKDQWKGLPDRFPEIKLHDFIIMPNHIHGIVGVPLVGTFRRITIPRITIPKMMGNITRKTTIH